MPAGILSVTVLFFDSLFPLPLQTVADFFWNLATARALRTNGSLLNVTENSLHDMGYLACSLTFMDMYLARNLAQQ
jgi:hypothetical protein